VLNIIKRLDKIIDDLNSLDIDSKLEDKLFNVVNEISEVQKQIIKPITIVKDKSVIVDVIPNYNYDIQYLDKPCDTE
tara:strand:+ start:43 stop:273 length:231 start_codon:yes stop_codon:yes gene_type:complete